MAPISAAPWTTCTNKEMISRTTRTLLLLVALTLAGCSSIGKRADDARITVQKVLDAALPADFEGDTSFSTRLTYGITSIRVTIRSGGLKRTAAGWSWKWLVYDGESPVSRTSVVFGAPPGTLLP